MKINEIIFNDTGIGTSKRHSQTSEYGIKVLMKPSVFLKLTPKIINSSYPDSIEFIKNKIIGGEPIATPVLRIDIPNSWKNNDFEEPAGVVGHNGRHRMLSILEVEGNKSVPVYLFFGDSNNLIPKNVITSLWLEQKNKIILNQDSYYSSKQHMIDGPIFQLIK
jgi:hypothetical protein